MNLWTRMTPKASKRTLLSFENCRVNSKQPKMYKSFLIILFYFNDRKVFNKLICVQVE